MQVLIVEDDEELADALATYLSARGLSTTYVTTCAQLLSSSYEEATTLLLDLYLPDGDAIELIPKLLTTAPACKIIVMTGRDSLPRRLRIFREGAVDYIQKPVFPAEIYERIVRFERYTQHDRLPSFFYPGLSREETSVLQILLHSEGSPVSSDVFLEEAVHSKSALYTVLSRLKAKVEATYIITCAYGRGWYIRKRVEATKQSKTVNQCLPKNSEQNRGRHRRLCEKLR